LLAPLAAAGNGCGASGCHASTALGEYPTTSPGHVSRYSVPGAPRGHAFAADCEQCHFGHGDKPMHRNGRVDTVDIVEFRPGALAPVYNQAAKTCSAGGCHVAATWADAPTDFNTETSSCLNCHGAPYSFAPRPLSGMHDFHLNNARGFQATNCDVPSKLALESRDVCSACHYNYSISSTHANGVLNTGTPVVSFHPNPGAGADCDVGPAPSSYLSANQPSCGAGCHGGRRWNQ